MRRSFVLLIATLTVFGLAALPTFALTTTPSPSPATPPATPLAPAVIEVTALVPRVIESYPHDTAAFTQGLVWNGETLYESTGQYGQSTLREVDLVTGEVIRSVPVSETFFAEGLAQVGDRLIQITWREATALVYDAATFEVIDEFLYETEGWGLCYDGEVLWMSDGTSMLYQRDPATFDLLATVPVTLFGQPVTQINELECVDTDGAGGEPGVVFANIWQTDFIVRIQPATGIVDGVVDARALLTAEERAALPPGGVLNGIAYRPEDDVFLLTGKLWPRLFEVTLEDVGTLQPRG